MRQEFPLRVKREAFDRCKGKCEGVVTGGHRCGLPLQKGKITYDHVVPDWMGGEPTLENCQVLGWCCDKPKTAKDQRDIAKTKRIINKDNGIKKKSKWATGRDSPFKSKIGGGVERR